MPQPSGLVSHNNVGSDKPQSYSHNKGGGQNYGNQDPGIVCYYCHEPGHTKRMCQKLLKKNQRGSRSQSAHMAAANEPPNNQSFSISADEYAKYIQFQEADGSISDVLGCGTINATLTLPLQSVLHLP
ncbi:hypothetical protein C2S52_017325 [Perilla frutescens var. hirtella]|nr:hypothetical protein C2S52_017325 [Perilla frutescens var. hirtella]